MQSLALLREVTFKPNPPSTECNSAENSVEPPHSPPEASLTPPSLVLSASSDQRFPTGVDFAPHPFLETVWVVMTWRRVLSASHGWRPEVLLNVPQPTGQPGTTKNHPTQDAEVRNPALQCEILSTLQELVRFIILKPGPCSKEEKLP